METTPTNVIFEFDKEQVYSYWLRSYKQLALIGFGGSFFFISLVTCIFIIDEKQLHPIDTLYHSILIGSSAIGIITATGVIIGYSIYKLYGKRHAQLHAENCHLSIEGNYIRWKEGVDPVIDYKVHFSHIDEYIIYESAVPRLTFALESCVVPRAIHGLSNPIYVRDLLIKVDKERENN